MGNNFTQSEKKYIALIAGLPEEFTTSEVRSGFPNHGKNTVNNYLQRLEEHGVIENIAWGKYKIAIPFFREYILEQDNFWA